MIAWPSRRRWLGPCEAEYAQIERIDESIDRTNRIDVLDEVIEAFGQQHRLPTVLLALGSVRAESFACSAAVSREIGGQIDDARRGLGLCNTGGWRSRRRALDVLGELSQVLGGGDEQNLVAGAAQSPQSEPVELQDALHVCKQHAC
jgi:hypothetical protein